MMNETTATMGLDYGISKLIARAAFIKEDAAIMGRELRSSERRVIEFVDNMIATHDVEVEVTQELPTGWLCPRCKTVNAPDVKRCECEPSVEDNRRGVLGPSETK
jgi:hypothetical protein